ncbi:hypothetical protein KC363_g8006 [Hortaea werneckii]|uniref:RING-type domain-containing protein n=1 Tax=Hortaea werneckii TaxID=91943 RepID=A0A3M7F365_HORWE|nr:hypothetical protein KC363_g8006 [Hortaea werneckii]RMY82981.1 hypothetical protein D0861_07641 [Hortaea werneckii]
MASATVAMQVDIEGLSAQHKQSLVDVEPGDLITFTKPFPEPETDSTSESERYSESEYEESGDEGASPFDYADDDGNDGLNGSDQQSTVEGVGSNDSVSNVNSEQEEKESDEEYPDSGLAEETEAFQQVVSTMAVYLVNAVDKDSNANTITDLSLVELVYDPQCGDAHTFQIIGQEIVYAPGPHSHCDHSDPDVCTAFLSLSDLAQDNALQGFNLHLNMPVDVAHAILDVNPSPCLADCDAGFLPSITDLPTYLPRSLYNSPVTSEHRPVCPVCMGLPLLREQQDLRYALHQLLLPDVIFGPAVEFIGRLNQRRARVGWDFYQFDEREWGLLFDDMPENDAEDGDDGNGGANAGGGAGWQTWTEAMDPNANVPLNPASDATIAALERLTYQQATTQKMDKSAAAVHDEGAETCYVCQEEYKPETMVVLLPCGHFMCDGSCTVQWLKSFAKCPVCREEIPDIGRE